MLRTLTLILAAAVLASCGMVSSDRPLFGPLDARGAPVLKPGLWALVQRGCKLNLRASPKRWPDCAQAADLRADGTAILIRHETRADIEHETTWLVAAGDPAVLQVQGPREEGKPRAPYVYFGVRPLASDVDGVIIRARVWPAFCARPRSAGPPPVRSKARPAKALAGLTPGMGPNANCLARGQRPVRNAVIQSEAWAFTNDRDEPGVIAYWVRDPEK